MSHLLKSSKEFEKMMSKKDVVSKEQVTAAMMHNWELNKTHDQQLASMCQYTVLIGYCSCCIINIINRAIQ